MDLRIYSRETTGRLVPLFSDAIHAGFESPATDYEEERIDLNDYVTSYPEATFYARVIGDCMVNSAIFEDDLLVVNRSILPSSGDVVVGVIDGEFILRVYMRIGNKEFLMADNENYKPIKRSETTQFQIWGVVSHSIHNQQKRKNVRIDRLQQFLRVM